MQTHAFIQFLLLHNWLISPDLVKRLMTAALTETEGLRNDLSVVTIRSAKLSHGKTNILVSVQRRALYVKT